MWYTTRPCNPTEKSQISHVVYDSTWEKVVADACEKSPNVQAWVKNDHLDFKIRYLWRGSSRNYLPDYLIHLTNGKILIIEVKGEETEQSKAKHAAMQQWVDAVNEQGGFGRWEFAVVHAPSDIHAILASKKDP